MSTLDGAVPLGLGITKLRLWDELHRAHCETLQQARHPSSSTLGINSSRIESVIWDAPSRDASLDLEEMPSSFAYSFASPSASPPFADKIEERRVACEADTSAGATLWPSVSNRGSRYGPQTSCSDWFLLHHRRDSPSEIAADALTSIKWADAAKDSHGLMMPPPAPKPGPSGRKPPPLVARIKAKARRAKRKQQKAEYRRRLFLSHMVQATREARQQHAAISNSSAKTTDNFTATPIARASASKKTLTQQKLSLLPERLGVDLGSFVEIVFDTDAQSSEITAPSDISDDDLARATKVEIETRKKLGGADVMVPDGVFRWMVARDFAERWPKKVRGVRKNPWPGLEGLWGLPSGVAPGEKAQQASTADEPMRWQSGRRSRFMRRKEKLASQGREMAAAVAAAADTNPLAVKSSESASLQQPVSAAMAVQDVSIRAPAAMPPSMLIKSANCTPQPQIPMQLEGRQTVTGQYGASISSQRLQSGWLEPLPEASDAISLCDLNAALTCSASVAFPGTVAGVPVCLA
ncbi:uncharacterized protein MEPE_02222 [Melanopsichium pennsylvanicum]|uniref:Uncharacterized protein n=2 Tax=Melanopsichium pennsylvanicum TaxID=63383 RepID=A0AAJ4XJX3_9BASI|nr:hypothetical protein BN887_05013 [Melanopsichium pennsylvanicum 4]SNX83515.1 uncharacterized protein MEPE_02222 [Melanopsichium pennsylvanicum]